MVYGELPFLVLVGFLPRGAQISRTLSDWLRDGRCLEPFFSGVFFSFKQVVCLGIPWRFRDWLTVQPIVSLAQRVALVPWLFGLIRVGFGNSPVRIDAWAGSTGTRRSEPGALVGGSMMRKLKPSTAEKKIFFCNLTGTDFANRMDQLFSSCSSLGGLRWFCRYKALSTFRSLECSSPPLRICR